MIYIVNKSNKPDFNIALEEFCFKKLLKHDKIFLLWINEPSIIVGKHQNVFEEINSNFVKEKGINVVRRISGGGAVYHDYNNLNYTIISNEEKGSDFDFKTFSQPVIDTLAELGVKANFTGRNDLQIDGKKICGNAQAYIKGRIMHHGCILFDSDLTILSKALEVSKATIKSNGTKSVRSEVRNIRPCLPEKIDVHQFADKILEHMKQKFPQMVEYKLNDKELAEIEQAQKERFGNWEWNYGKSPKSNIVKEKRFKAGKIQTFIDVENALIKDIKFFGTFFGNNPNVEFVEQLLKGIKYDKEHIKKVLASIDYNQYFAGFSLDELIETIIG